MNTTSQSIAWSTYRHAYGSAEDIPEALEALKSVDSAVRAEALDRLSVSIYHQGDLYSATGPAVAALIRLAANQETPDRPHILGLVAAIAESTTRLPGQFIEIKKARSAFADSPDYSLNAMRRAESGFREVLLPVQVALASQHTALENLLGDHDQAVASEAESILDLIRGFPYSDICGPVYRSLNGIEHVSATAFASAYPMLTFSELASHLGKRISAEQVWWALLGEAQTGGNIEALARSTLVREVRKHTRERGWGVGMHFERMLVRLESAWFSRFSDYPEQCEAAWAWLLKNTETGWLPQSPDDPIIRACIDEGWRKPGK